MVIDQRHERTTSLVTLKLQNPAHQVRMFTEYGRSVGIAFVVRSQEMQ